ncbi:2-polyprenyl-3-methyl-6-methoxy-1,4-benzoquinone monooxygenase [Derxia lacustris]|uniref:2-polyprenyl-3-methyl-6-methoxy-1,4-benzoquinone monooxygenase n=1 Tax=Derxia lacustris TaxID=764842 RepID=UPI000A173263|nr:2-polyprenyl-3-methyl-6-methoxy-1,4-benzoquinone monooxygenase [Derxia lacustris]
MSSFVATASARQLSTRDRVIVEFDTALRSVFGVPATSRELEFPVQSDDLPASERELAGSLMRVNHVGEVCAQALYQSQALTARDERVREQFRQAAAEERDHLAWTARRIEELGAHRSRLNPLWYLGAFAIGAVAGRIGDAASLGFMAETERQVEAHLAGHLDRLPATDVRSRAIVEQMKADEVAHADAAVAAGGWGLPAPVKGCMRLAARVMTSVAAKV